MDGEATKLSIQLTARGKRLEVRATAQQGEARVEVALPPPALYDAVAQLDQTTAPSPTLQAAGKQLYECLTAGDAGKLTTAVFHDAQALRLPVHLELRFDPDQTSLARLPWELLMDDYGRALVLDGLANVTRYITYPQAPPALEPAFDSDPLLRVVARPRGLPELAIGDLPVPKILTLDHASFEEFERKLLIERLATWGMHFDGHGFAFLACVCGASVEAAALLRDPQARCERCRTPLALARLTGVLAFEQNSGPRYVTTQEVGTVLYNSRACLAMLLACESARVGGQTLFSGLAPGLLLAGVPAVVGMQYPVTDEFAHRFAHNFYSALLGERDILSAMHTARRLTREGSWYSPVLYLRQQSQKITTEPIYRTRHIDTATPAQVQAGKPFLARLWIRRPETAQLAEPELRRELGVAPSVLLSARSAAADVRFEPIEGRRLRRGEVQVELAATGCSVEPKTIKLFVDEHLDAPPAIFTVRPQNQGRSVTLRFTVYQDGGLIVSANHFIEVMKIGRPVGLDVNRASCEVSVQRLEYGAVGQDAQLAVGSSVIQTETPSARRCPHCGALNPSRSSFCSTCGVPLEDSKSKCAFSDSTSTHKHLGPFERCAACGKTICSECVGRHLPTGVVWCIRCVSDSPKGMSVRKSVRKIESVHRKTRPSRPSAYGTSKGRRSGSWRHREDRRGAYFEVSYSTLADKVQFGFMFALVIVAVVVGALIYANINIIPIPRVILAIVLTCASWAVMSVNLRFLFDRPLGRTASQIISYILASFLGCLVFIWLIRWTWLDRILRIG